MYDGKEGWIQTDNLTKIGEISLWAPTLKAPDDPRGGDDLDISWKSIDGASHYKINAVLSDDESVVLKSVDITRDTSFIIPDAPEGKTLKITVTTVSILGEKSAVIELPVKIMYFRINDDSIKADEEGLLITGVKENVSVSDFKAKFDNDIKVLRADGEEAADGLVGTGFKVQSIGEGGIVKGEFTVIIKGDIDGDGTVSSADYTALKANFKSASATLDEIQAKAADATGNDKLTVSDYILIKRHIQKSFDLFA